MRKALSLFFVVSFVTVIACGGSKGDSCDGEGKVGGECDEGFVCGKSKSEGEGELICLTQCDTQVNCAANEDCNGVGKTSLKGCRPE
jgi:hypothetical protein